MRYLIIVKKIQLIMEMNNCFNNKEKDGVDKYEG